MMTDENEDLPLVKGGQGRSGDEAMASAMVIVWLLAGLSGAIGALAIGACW